MTFDHVFMNPPYDSNLHLKILENAIELLKDENSICINLSPSRALQDPLAKYKQGSDYKKFEETVFKHMRSIDIIDGITATKIFGAVFSTDLGIFVFTKNSYETYKEINTNNIVDKVVSKGFSTLGDKLEENVSDGWRVRVQKIRPFCAKFPDNDYARGLRIGTTNERFSWVYNNGFTTNNVHWTNNVHHKAGPVKYTENDPLPMSIPFPNEMEAVNFENSTKTTFHRYLVLTMKTDQNFPMNYVPFMGDCINPRTGKKGYESDWTDDDFRKYFDITDSEWKEIIETMKPYL